MSFRRDRSRGFTLIEIMVVLVILGVVVTVAVVRAPSGNRELAVEAARVAAALDLLAQQAVIRGVPHALETEIDGYIMREFRLGEWVGKQLPGVRPKRVLPASVRLDLLADRGAAAPPRRIVLLPSGEASARGFSLYDSGSGDAVHYALNDAGRFERVQ